MFVSVALLLSVNAAAQLAVQYQDEATFLAAVASPSLIDFEGFVEPDGFLNLGNPGEFTDSGVTITSNSWMFLQNNDFYGTGAFLSPQQSNPEIVEIVLPAYTTAVGFSYSSAAATADAGASGVFDLPAVTFGSLGFFGITQESPIDSVTITIAGPGIDIDDFWFVVDPPDAGAPNVPGGGAVDTNFGDNGVLLFDDLTGSFTTNFEGLAVQPGGNFILSGVVFRDGAEPQTAVLRIDLTGALDTTFGTDGITLFNFGAGVEEVNDIAVLADGSILIAGQTGYNEPDRNGFVAKLDADGAFDSTFGNNGILVDNLVVGFSDSFQRMDVQDDGKLILGSRYYSVSRLLANGSRD